MDNSDINIDVIIPSHLQSIIHILPLPIAFYNAKMKVIWQNKAFSKLHNTIDINNLNTKISSAETNTEEKFSANNESYKLNKIRLNLKENNKIFLIYVDKDISSKDEELKTIAHDLNNIFTGISNSIELLNHKKEDYPELSRTIQGLENNSNRAIELFEEFLTKDKTQKTKKKKINLNILLEEISVTMAEIVKGNVEVELNILEELSPILGRYSEIFRILLNLCVNAKDAMKESGGIINIRAQNYLDKNNVKSVLIKVKDNGTGISEDNLSKIFNKGFSTKDGKKISGLGLSIVKQIVEEHEGTISVESVLGKGTEFTIIFPSIVKKEKSINDNLPKTICIAEDEEIIREELTELFEYEGFKVVQAANGKQAVEILLNNKNISLLIIDKKMPGQGGLESIEILRNQQINIPIILATGSVPDYENKKIQLLNIDQIMKKPYSIDELIDNVKNLLG